MLPELLFETEKNTTPAHLVIVFDGNDELEKGEKWVSLFFVKHQR